MNDFRKTTSLLAAALVVASLPARAEMVDRVVAVVNDDIVALSEVEQRAGPELARLRAETDTKRRNTQRTQVMSSALDELIGEKLLEREISELGITVTDRDIDMGIENVMQQNNMDAAQFEQLLRESGYNMASYREFMGKRVKHLKLIDVKVRSKVKISDNELRAEYANYSKLETQDPEVHARHIFLKLSPNASAGEIEATRKRAEALAEEARKPGVDFVTLVKTKSEGPSKEDGGDLGFFRRGVMVPEFEKVAFNLPDGSVSDPVRTKLGWHVLKVEERRASNVKPFEEMKDQLRQRLYEKQLEKYTEQHVQELRSQAVIEKRL